MVKYIIMSGEGKHISHIYWIEYEITAEQQVCKFLEDKTKKVLFITEGRGNRFTIFYEDVK